MKVYHLSMWIQKTINLRPRPRGFHIVTSELLGHLPELSGLSVGWVQFFLQHTSASLTINENAEPDVRLDFERHLGVLVPENAPYYEHTIEGADDMPAHIKSSLLGASVMVPIKDGGLCLGTWQGIYLGEHRNQGGSRTVIATINGEP